MDERDRYQTGMQHRRAVLGDAWVDGSNARLNDFNREFQDLITRYAWGENLEPPGARPQDALVHGARNHMKSRHTP